MTRDTKAVVAALEGAGWRVWKYNARWRRHQIHEADFCLGPTKKLRSLGTPGALQAWHEAVMGRTPPARPMAGTETEGTAAA
jgi:hypothetical protein